MTSSAALHSSSDLQAIANHVGAGQFPQALAIVDRMLEQSASDAELWYLKGTLHKKCNDVAGAIAAFNRAVQEKPDYKEACLDLAQMLEKSGKTMLAVQTYEHFLKMLEMSAKPAIPPALSPASDKTMREWFYKALSLYKQGQSEKSIPLFRKALVIAPDLPETLVNLSMALYSLRRFAEAEKVLLHCLHVCPRFAEALNVLGNVLKDTERTLFAVAAYRQALAFKPTLRHAAINIGKVFYEMQKYPESIAAYEHTLTIDPDYIETLTELGYLLNLICQWDKVEEYKMRAEQVLRTTPQCAEPFIFAVGGSIELQQENARRWARKLFAAGKPYDAGRPLPASKRPGGRLRVGYLSSDFMRHATAALISEMFEQHDRSRFEVYAYSYGIDDKGPERARIMRAVDRFCDIRMMDDRAAWEQMQRDELDIMVDLKGYTQGHRLGLLAPRPAPIQLHYLGHPGTTGAVFVDYFVADHVTTPPGMEKEFSEKIIRLPHSYQMNDRSRPLPRSGPPRAFYGLPEERLVFADFNNPYKITPQMFGVWMRLLSGVPGSVLWLYETQPLASENLRREAQERGVDPARIIFARPALMPDHLARYRHVDLFLDTAPVCGHTTISDVLWCAVPPVVLAGNSFISRVAESLLCSVGLSALVASDLESYEALALALARDPQRRQSLKRHLEDGRMTFPLFDSLHTTRALEAAFIHMARRHREGLAPQAFSVGKDWGIGV